MLADQEEIRREPSIGPGPCWNDAQDSISASIGVMEGWRLTRLPRIDRDILRPGLLSTFYSFGTPAAVACNESGELANRYSDDQGRRMINGVLRPSDHHWPPESPRS